MWLEVCEVPDLPGSLESGLDGSDDPVDLCPSQACTANDLLLGKGVLAP